MTIIKRLNIKLFEYFTAFLICFLCFWNFSEWSLTNDELSALNRLTFDSLGELIENGIRIDGHPALTQLFLFYWIKLFGTSVFWLRLPSVLLSLLGIYFFYQFSKKIFHQKAALLCILTVALTQYFLNYAQLARPYAYGFFSLSFFAYASVKFREQPYSVRLNALFVLSLCLAFISHYLATLSALLLLFSAFVLFAYQNWKRFLLLCIISASLLLLHLNITLGHLKIGGLGWLPLPKQTFYREFLLFAQNNSWKFVTLPFALLFLYIVFRQAKLSLKNQLWILVLGFAPYLIIYGYTIFFSPVMQFSSLYFSFPFYLLFLFSFLKKECKWIWFVGSYFLIVGIGISSLFSSNHFFKKRPFENFKSVIKLGIQYQEKNAEKNILIFTNTNDPNYFNYYYKAFKKELTPEISQFQSIQDSKAAIQKIESQKADEIILLFAGLAIPEEVYEFAKYKYPIIKAKSRFFNSDFIVLSKGKKERKTFFKQQFSPHNSNWEQNLEQWTDSVYYTAPSAYFIPNNAEYSATFRGSVSDIFSEKHPWLTLHLKLKSDSSENLKLVMQVMRNNELIDWKAIGSKEFYQKDQWYSMVCVWRLSEKYHPDDEISFYLWNPEQGSFFMDDFQLANYLDSDYFFYER